MDHERVDAPTSVTHAMRRRHAVVAIRLLVSAANGS
jgi:hypothetical protein